MPGGGPGGHVATLPRTSPSISAPVPATFSMMSPFAAVFDGAYEKSEAAPGRQGCPVAGPAPPAPAAALAAPAAPTLRPPPPSSPTIGDGAVRGLFASPRGPAEEKPPRSPPSESPSAAAHSGGPCLAGSSAPLVLLTGSHVAPLSGLDSRVACLEARLDEQAEILRSQEELLRQALSHIGVLAAALVEEQQRGQNRDVSKPLRSGSFGQDWLRSPGTVSVEMRRSPSSISASCNQKIADVMAGQEQLHQELQEQLDGHQHLVVGQIDRLFELVHQVEADQHDHILEIKQLQYDMKSLETVLVLQAVSNKVFSLKSAELKDDIRNKWLSTLQRDEREIMSSINEATRWRFRLDQELPQRMSNDSLLIDLGPQLSQTPQRNGCLGKAGASLRRTATAAARLLVSV